MPGSAGGLEARTALAEPPPRSRVPIAADAGAAASEAALAQLSERLEEARRSGRLALDLPVSAIVADHLARDRMVACDIEMAALIESIRDRGQQTPIEVVELGQNRFGLISGWRRLMAIRHLAQVTGAPEHATILAVLRNPATAAEAYVAMVEENEIRAGLSHYERARIVAQAVARGVYPDTRRALRGLFAQATRPRRSKIGSFLTIVEALDDVLDYPTALGERFGLALAKRLTDEPGIAAEIRRVLVEAPEPPASAEEEQARLRAVLEGRAGRPRPSARAAEPPGEQKGGPGIRIVEEGDRIVLSGPGLTPDLRRALRAWLAETAGAEA